MEKYYLSESIVNTGRQKELDLAKSFAIVLMIFCHTGMSFYEPYSVGDIFSGKLGSEFAAPVFMVCLGIGTVYSKHNQENKLFFRGVKTLFLGYLLNFFREGLILIIAKITGHGLIAESLFVSMARIDIMQFAGMAFITLALFKKFKISATQQFMIGLLCAGIGEFLAWHSLNSKILNALFGLIWGTCGYSYFPLLNWLAFPTAGVLFGNILYHCSDKTKLYKSIFFIGLVGVVFAYIQMFTDGEAYYNNGSYYFMGIKNVIFALCFPIVMFSICQFTADKTGLADKPIVAFGSKNLNAIYCISWILIMWSSWVIQDVFKIELSGIVIVTMMFVILALSYLIAKINLDLKSAKAQSGK